jgi:uncharacterized protein YeaO (DUF488 family)
VPRPRNDQPQVRVARAYEEPAGDGYRVLVDRLWPRGMAKDHLELDEWATEVAPSTELRRWYGHDPDRFDEFARRYRQELRHQPGAEIAARLAGTARTRELVLVTATRDVDRSGAAVLADHLAARREGQAGRRT